MNEQIHDCLIQVEKRAEGAGDKKLLETFVDAAPLFSSISTRDHQIIFGRRGTGKTHLLKYLCDNKRENGDIALYLDVRVVGSNSSIYNDGAQSLSQRATFLLYDILAALHDALLTAAIEVGDAVDLSIVGPLLDDFAECLPSVEVVGEIETSEIGSEESSGSQGLRVAAEISPTIARLDAGGEYTSNTKTSRTTQKNTKGRNTMYVRFGSVQRALDNISGRFGSKRIYLILDEWSEIPLDLQPYLADLLRRCVLPLNKFTVKIAAIEHRSNFYTQGHGGYTGIELGADAGADVNLDDFMVFENDADRSKRFFATLLFKHYKATDVARINDGPKSADELVLALFTQVTAFEEYVRAVEGVPRDAVYLAATLAKKSYGKKFSTADVRTAARSWYNTDKSVILRSNDSMNSLLKWIIELVIAHRKTRAFLLEVPGNKIIDALFDARLLHVLKRNISSKDAPGERYDVYKLDYGCYVDLISTSRNPLNLFVHTDDIEMVVPDGIEVPPDDYRSIRRSILNLEEYEFWDTIESEYKESR